MSLDHSSKMINISAIIVVKDNPPHLFETLDSVEDLASEIIVADIGIETNLLERIKKYKKVKCVKVNEEIPYVEVIREKLKKHAKYDYIFFLDPDEIVPEKLQDFIKNNVGTYDYLKIPRKNIIFGKWIEHARWWPDYQIRLFKKESVIWPSHIHHQPNPKGKELVVDPKEELALVHHNYATIDEYLTKMYRYAKAEAQELVTNRQNFTLQQAIQRSLSEFMGRFFADKGYRDGTRGFVLSLLQMFNYFLVYMYYWEMKGKFESKPEELTQDTQLFFQQGLKETNHWIMKEKLIKSLNTLKIKFTNKLL